MDTNTTRMYLLRHGATEANRATPYRLQGRGRNLGLDEVGLIQVEQAARALMALELKAVYSSPLLRACQTAKAIVRMQSQPLEVQTVPELIEACVGDWENLTWQEIQERDPDLYGLFMANPGSVPYKNGESFQDVQNRCVPAFQTLAALHPGETIAVVAHNVVNRAYLAALLGLPISRARQLSQANAGINLVEYERGVPRLVTMNSQLHLEPPRQPQPRYR